MIKVKSPIYISKAEYGLVLLLMFLSGNQAVRYYVTEWVYILVTMLICIYCFSHKKKVSAKIDRRSIGIAKQYLALLVVLFVIQTLVLGWNTFGGIINFLCKTFIGCFVVTFLGYKFKHAYLHLMFYISIIDILFWIVQLNVGTNMGLLHIGKEYQTIIFFHTRARETLRNCGFYWEPGAYGCYLLFIPILFYNEIRVLITTYRRESFVLLIAILSTMSTTTYLTFALMIILYFILELKSIFKYILIPFILFGMLHLYTSIDFLSEKIETQTENSLETQGDYSSSRMGSFLFDLHYIKKHPFVGNGMHENTRYSDHLIIYEMIRSGELHNNGNGFSDSFAKYGIFFFVIFIVVFFKHNKNILLKYKILILVFIFMLLQGEHLFNYPFLLSIPLVKLKSVSVQNRCLVE